MEIDLDIPDCEEHPRYQGKRKPRLTCEACWLLFIVTKYGSDLVSDTLRSLFENFEEEAAPSAEEAPTTRYSRAASLS